VAALDRTTVILAGVGIGLPVGFCLYLLWVVTDSVTAVIYGGILFMAVGLLIWSGMAFLDRRDKR
jgi:hypothetical protein